MYYIGSSVYICQETEYFVYNTVGVLEPGVPQPASEFVLRAPNPGW